jgi:HK97 gp10 family phage protein
MRLSKYIDQGSKIAAMREGQREYRLMQKQLNQDFAKIKKKLAELKNGGMTLEEEEEILRYASKPLVEAAKSKAPVSPRNVVKVTSGDGSKSFFIERGNLQASIMEIRFRRRRSGYKGKLKGRKGGVVVFGPKVDWKPRDGQRFGPSVRSVNAYYANMVEYGTRNMDKQPFMRPAYEATKGLVLGRAKAGLAKAIQKWARKNEIGR